MGKITESQNNAEFTSGDIEIINTQIQINSLDNFQTTTSLVQATIKLIKKRVPFLEAHIFVYIILLHELSKQKTPIQRVIRIE